MLLRWILFALLGVFVARLLGRLFGGSSDRPRAPRSRLDPQRAVRASWSEVDDEGEREGSGER